MSCIINVDLTRAKALTGLYNYCGTNCSQFYSYLTTVIKNINSEGELTFTPEFKASWKSKSPLDINTTPTEELKDAIIKFFNSKYPSVKDGIRKTKAFDKVSTFGYTSVGAREEGKRLFANKMLAAYHKNENMGKQRVNENLKAYYAQYAMSVLSKTLAKRLAKLTGIDEKTIISNLKDNNAKYISDILVGHKQNINLQLQNLIALYTEFSSSDLYKSLNIEKPENAQDINPREDFIDEVMNDSRLGEIRLDRHSSEDDMSFEISEDEDKTEDNEGEPSDQIKDAEYDTSIQVLNNKLGLTTTFMTHVGAPLRALLGSLPKMTTSEQADGKFFEDKDNNFGIADVMDANLCATVLYHYGRYDNPTEMMKSIKEIAERIPGFAAFSKLYDILDGNISLQLEFYRTFSKIAIGKLETVVEHGESKNRISNGGIDRQSVLKFQLMNAIKGTSLTIVPKYAMKQAALLKIAIQDYNPLTDTDGTQIRSLCDKLAEQLKAYYPTIDNLDIRNYVLLNTNTDGNIDTKANLNALYVNLTDTIKGADKTQNNYKDRESAIFVARRHNAKLKKQREETGQETSTEGNIDLNPLYAESYIDISSEAAATRLAQMLLPYTLISTPLNSRNVHGNQSSDIINSSMMTSIMNTLQSQLNSYKEVTDENGIKKRVWSDSAPIVRFGEHRFQSKQYDFSNILLEHYDEKGNRINYGLFYEDRDEAGNVKYVPTDYALHLLQIRLFNGASNLDDSSNALYADMTKGDYIGTAWRNFFKSSNTIPGVEESADYFMRIPSDAPKTFTITAPKYSVEGLLKIGNRAEITEQITNFIETVSTQTLDSINTVRLNDFPIVVAKHGRGLNLSTFVEHLQTINGSTVNIKLPLNRQRNFKDDKTKKIQVAFRYAATNGDKKSDNVYVMEGTYYNGVLHDAQFVGFKKDSVDASIWQDVHSNIWENKNKLSSTEGGIKWNINTNHVLFKQLVNSFTQELTDMATASTVMFEKVKDRTTKNYRIKVDDKGHPVIIKKSDIVKGNNDHNGLHPIYHFADDANAGKGALYVVDENGVAHATGNVFKSDRFVLYDYFAKDGEQPIRNYGQEILDEAFSLFRTRTTDSKLVLQFDADGNVVLTDAQKEAIERHLKEFILDYIEHARHRMQNFENFAKDIKGGEINTNNLAEFVLNTHLTYIAMNDMFEGDTKFYKNTQTFLKRAKESQGSGVPYGIVDFTRPIQPGHNEIHSPLDTATFVHKTSKGNKSYQIKAYDTFSAITIYNTIRTDVPMLETLISALTDEKVMGNKVLTEEQARNLLYGPVKKDKKGNPIIKNGQVVREGGYQDTTVNDAQSYITFDEWVRRITARGQLPKYKELIDKILDETTPLTVEDIEAFVQVQKNFYYDQYYNDKTKTISPRQIKNAEFVLVPRLIAGTELEKVAKLMEKLGVDQLNTVETSKAGQSERFTLWDENGHISQEILDDIDNPGEEYKSDIMINGSSAKEYFNYNYLYTQQETPQHVNSENKAGIQIMKKILDNIDANSPKELRDAKEEFFNLYAANIQHSFNSLMQRFNVELDENGNIVLDGNGNIKGLNYKEFFNALKEELTRLGLDSNMIDYCTQDPNSPDPSKTIMPNYMSLVAGKFENIVQSLFNHNITRQTLPGFHAAQISGMGFRKLSEQVDRSMTSNILQYHPQLYKNKNTGKEITQREYNLLDDTQKKEYEKSRVAGYVEIMLPASNFGFDRHSEAANKIRQNALDAGKSLEEAEEAVNHMFLVQLQQEGLDEIIGYRIPTEGKQSVCCMKVVGFTDDAYGSTIVVPDAWVSQTGADFDIDSVYGIQYSTYFDKSGKIKQVKYKTKFNTYDWMNYVSKVTKIKHAGLTTEEFDSIKEEAKQETKLEKKLKRELEKNRLNDIEQEAWLSLDENTKAAIRQLHAELIKNYGKATTKESFIRELWYEIELLNKRKEDLKNDYSEEELNAIQDFIDIRQEILNDILNNTETDFNYSEVKSKKIKSKVDEFKLARYEQYEQDAKDNGLLLEEEFLEKANSDIISNNSTEARNNRLLDDIKLMLTHSDSFEENLSRSNFDDIISALNKCIVGDTNVQRKARSPYNIFDQAEYQEDAMSGAKLKAFSVVRDTFCSICNTLHPTLENNAEIRVFYSGDNYDEETLKKRFGANNVISSTGGFIVTHRTFGWTNDNKNIDGKILTAYSSQTTAHILDAIKSGNVPNVNDLTFQVYKTLVDVGSNYDTAVSFIMQPGVRRIVDAFNATNSIYAEEKGRNYVLQAVRNILDELGLEYERSQSVDDLLAIVNSNYGDIAGEIFGEDFEFSVADEDNAKFALNSQVQINRLENSGIFSDTTPVEERNINATPNEIRLLYDLQTILQYNKLDKLANNIRDAARVSNPDRFGAKQTIFATRQVFDNIVRSIQDNQYEDGSNFRLQVNGQHILSAVYPGLEEVESGDDALNSIINNPDFVKDSKYKSLAAFLKYATATSIKINKTLFITQTDEFIGLIMDRATGLASKLSNGNYISEKTAKDFQNYVVNYIIMQSEFLQAPLKYSKAAGGARGFEYIGKAPKTYNEDEAIRVFGYGHPVGLIVQKTHVNDEGKEVTISEPFTVENINDPSQEEEIDNFNSMSPAQKVTWIKRHFREAGVFKYIDTQLFNEYATRGRRAGTQTMIFDETGADIETVRREFEEAFTNRNPLVASAAADIIKYAFFVEGYRMGMGNVSKMIPNSVLLNGGRIYGTNIVNNANVKFGMIDALMEGDTANQVIENFIRSHVNSVGINFHNVTRNNKSGFELARRSHDLIQINGTTDEGKTLCEKYGITYKDRDGVTNRTNSYVRLGFGNKRVLYKIREERIGSKTVNYFLIPINELETNENSEWSANSSNNIYPSQEFYDTLITNYITRVADMVDEGAEYHSDVMQEESKALDKHIQDFRTKNDFRVTEHQAIPLGNINTNPTYRSVIQAINEWYKDSIVKGQPTKFIWNIPLNKNIVDFGPANGVVQRVILDDGSIQNFRIYKYNASYFIKKYTGKHIDKDIDAADLAYTELIGIIRNIARTNDNNYVPTYYDSIYAIESTDLDIADDDDGLDFSSLTDVAVQSTSGVYRRSHNVEDVRAGKVAQFWKDKGITAKKDNVETNMDDIIINAAKYLEETVAEIENKLRHFPCSDGTFAVDDVHCINEVKKDPLKRKEYLKLLLEPNAIVEEFGLIRELDIESEDPLIQQYLKKIKAAVEKMQNLPLVANAYEKFAQEYYDKATDNPLVRQGMISVLDGFYKTNWANAMFNDIQETSNPIIQIAMKNFQADLRAKQMQARRQADAFIKHIEDIKKRAQADGKSFDLNHIIDEAGRFKQLYNDKLLEDRNKLKQAVNDAAKEFDAGSIEHLKAKLEYDEWKVAHVEQPVVSSYYKEKNRLLRSMLYPNTEGMTPEEIDASGVKLYATYLSRYETARLKRAELRNKYQTDAENPELDREMERLDLIMFNLQYAQDGEDEPIAHAKDKLQKYVRDLRNLENTYFKYDPVYNFEALVEENRKIVESFELSDKPANLYADNPDYIRAKTWLRRNVIVEPDYGESSNAKAELEEAYNNLPGAETRLKYKAIIYNKAYRNKDGEFDPRLVPDDEIDKLRKDQEKNYNISDEHPFSDRTLIGNGNPDGTIYTKDFYKGMTEDKSKTLNPKWQETVTRINELLSPYYNEFTHEVDLESIPYTEEGIKVLKELRQLYDKLSEIRGGKKSATAKKFIKENVKFDYNKEKYEADIIWAKGLPRGSFRGAVMDLIKDVDYDGNVVHNTYLYGFVRPKDDKLDKFTDAKKTKALETLAKYKEKRLRSSYAQAKYEARHNKSTAEYEAWYKRNHIYNPYTHAYEPIAIWWETVDKADKYNYYPKFPQTIRTIRDGKYTHKEAVEHLEDYDEEEFATARELENHYFADMDYRNKNYDPNGGHAANYIPGSNPAYDNHYEANKYELEAMKYMQDTLLALANTQDSQKYLKNGWLPARNKERPNDTRGWIKEIFKTFGWTNETYNPDDWYDDVDYSKDRPNPMPMLERIKGKGYKEVPRRPKQREGQTDENYAAELAKWEKDKADIEKVNMDIHKSLIDRDWINVISDFIVRAGTYNAVQDNKYELFYAQQLLKKYGAYVTAYNKKGQMRFKKNVRNSNETEAEYLRRQDKYLIEQFDNQLRRILYNQFKTPNPPKLMKWMSTLQSLTSAQYMMLNVKGGIANVTLGETQIAAEAFAREFFNVKLYAKGKLFYNGGVHDYILHSNDDKAGTLQGAIIKFMDVVDYDEHTGVSRLTKDAYEVLKKIRNYGYTPQTAGEHGMQNSAMFTMMMSHRLFLNSHAAEFGQPKYIVKNLAEHIRDTHEKALLAVLTDAEIEEYNKYKERISSDANDFKKYAWYQKDVTSEFAEAKLDINRQREFIKKRDELQKNLEKEFNDDTKHPTLLSQLALGEDGKMTIKTDSMLAEIDVPKENGDPSDALQLLANFKGRVIAVNKYIHGVYDKSGRAQFEKTFLGSLVMQYHKHLPMGIMKRYRIRGMYSEERGAVAKGMYRSLYDYLSIPFRKHKDVLGLTDEEADTGEGIKNIFKNVVDFALHYKLAYNLMPEYDRANIRRMKGDIYGVLAAVALTIAIKAGADDDDEEGLLYNLALYEADRLATEAAQYNPFVAYTEAKKLWQSPIAAGSGITDLLSSANLLAHMIADGKDFDGEYHSGKFAGESKLKVYIERRIPIWRGIKSSFIDIKTNNQFYKIGENMLSFIDTDAAAKKLKGK